MKQDIREGFSRAIVFWVILGLGVMLLGLAWMQAEMFGLFEASNDHDQEEVDEVVADRVVEVTAEDMAFNPGEITVVAGETVEFDVEVVDEAHSMYFPGLEVGTDVLQAGERASFTYTFDEAGTYEFECTVEGHAEAGMVGQVVVEEAEENDVEEEDDVTEEETPVLDEGNDEDDNPATDY